MLEHSGRDVSLIWVNTPRIDKRFPARRIDLRSNAFPYIVGPPPLAIRSSNRTPME
jgi:hypothetical protein